MTLRILAVVALCAGLGGCFTSAAPLIPPAQAEFPVAAPAEIDSVHADGTSSPLWLERQADVYVLVDRGGKKDGKPSVEVKHRFVVRGIGGGLFVAQRFPDSGALACPCMYGLIEMKGGRISVYDFEDFGSSQQLSDEEIARYGITIEDGNYQLSSFDATAQLFRVLLERPRPDNVYRLK